MQFEHYDIKRTTTEQLNYFPSFKLSISTTGLCMHLLLFAYIKWLIHWHQWQLKLLLKVLKCLIYQQLFLYTARENVDILSNPLERYLNFGLA